MSCLGNDTVLEQYELVETQLDRYYTYWLYLCAPLAIIANILVLLIAIKHVHFDNHLNQVFVVALTIGDLLSTLVHVISRSTYICFPRLLCSFYYLTWWNTQILSVMALLLLNVDKCLSKKWPLQYYSLMTSKLVKIELAGVLLPSVLLVTLVFVLNSVKLLGEEFGFYEEDISECLFRMEPLSYSLFVSLMFVCPNVISMAISTYVFCLAKAKSPCKQPLRLKAKRLVFVFSATVWSCVTFLPYRMAVIGYAFYDVAYGCTFNADLDCPSLPIWVDSTKLLLFLLPLGAVGNPIITIITQKRYRKKVAGLLKPKIHRTFV